MSQGLPEKEVRATCASLAARLDHYTQQIVEILGPNWKSDLSNIEGMSREQALNARQQVTEFHFGVGKLLASIPDKLKSWSLEAGITVGEFMISLSKDTQKRWADVIADLNFASGRMDQARIMLLNQVTVRETFGEKLEKLTPEAFGATAIPEAPAATPPGEVEVPPPQHVNQEAISNYSITNPQGRVRKKLGAAYQGLKSASQKLRHGTEKLVTKLRFKRGR